MKISVDDIQIKFENGTIIYLDEVKAILEDSFYYINEYVDATPDKLAVLRDKKEKYELLKLSTSKIVVNGYIENDINKVVELEILGDKGNTKSHLAGDIVSSGKYIILSSTDKIIGDKMMQLLEVGRSDTGKVN